MKNFENKAEQEIKISEIILCGWENKFLIIAATFIFALSGLFYSLSLPDIYTSDSLLVKAKDSKATNTSFNSVLRASGVNFDSGTLDDGGIAQETINSRDFLAHLLTFPDVLPSLMASLEYNQETKQLIFDERIYDSKEKKWVGGQEGIPSFLNIYKEYTRNVVFVDYDRSRGFMRISVSHKSPIFAKEFLDLIIAEVNENIRQYDLQRTNEHLDYLERELKGNGYKEVKTAMNSILESQLITKMQSMISKEYTIRKISAPFVPGEKASPWRTGICLGFTFLGAFLSFAFVIIRQYFFADLQKILKASKN